MNDDVKDALELARSSAASKCQCIDCRALRVLIPHIDGEPARLTPLKDEIAALRARVAELERQREGMLMGGVTTEARQQLERAEKAESKIADLEYKVEEMKNGLDEYAKRASDTCRLGFEQAEKAEAELDALRTSIEVCLAGGPSIRVCEGGGPEDLAASLAVTMLKLRMTPTRIIEMIRKTKWHPGGATGAVNPERIIEAIQKEFLT